SFDQSRTSSGSSGVATAGYRKGFMAGSTERYGRHIAMRTTAQARPHHELAIGPADLLFRCFGKTMSEVPYVLGFMYGTPCTEIRGQACAAAPCLSVLTYSATPVCTSRMGALKPAARSAESAACV